VAPDLRARYKEDMEAGVVPRLAAARVPMFNSPVLLRVASDARLVALIREGRATAFEVAYDRHHRTILSFCRHMLGDADEAEDAVQHTFTAAYADLMASSKPIHLRPWLFTIARNRCYSVLRARREQPVAELDEVAVEGVAAQVQTREELRELVSDLQRLPEEQRAALVLAELDALPHAEISEALGVPREKVKALVFQARESLLASRAARETACIEIRAQIATGRGPALRRGNLRRHLRECDGCREFRAQVDRQRRHFALLLPVAPTIAMKQLVLGGTVGSGLIGGGLLAPSALKSAVAKGVMGALLAGAGTAGTVVVAANDLHLAGPAQKAKPSMTRGVHGIRTVRTGHASHRAGGTQATLLSAVGRSTQPVSAAAAWRSMIARHAQAPIASGRHAHRARVDHTAGSTGTSVSGSSTGSSGVSYAVAAPTGLGTGAASSAGVSDRGSSAASAGSGVALRGSGSSAGASAGGAATSSTSAGAGSGSGSQTGSGASAGSGSPSAGTTTVSGPTGVSTGTATTPAPGSAGADGTNGGADVGSGSGAGSPSAGGGRTTG
jgi:RNA polymerase sigma factor (sigma-70 family)